VMIAYTVGIISGLVSVSFLLVFFFQAEDGIRDSSVTGVQTCALPISTRAEVEGFVNDSSADAYARVVDRLLASPAYGERMALERSEERRVGKECRCGWWAAR